MVAGAVTTPGCAMAASHANMNAFLKGSYLAVSNNVKSMPVTTKDPSTIAVALQQVATSPESHLSVAQSALDLLGSYIWLPEHTVVASGAPSMVAHWALALQQVVESREPQVRPAHISSSKLES
jgi:hypothetical protein